MKRRVTRKARTMALAAPPVMVVAVVTMEWEKEMEKETAVLLGAEITKAMVTTPITTAVPTTKTPRTTPTTNLQKAKINVHFYIISFQLAKIKNKIYI